MSLLSATEISLTYGNQKLLESVSLTIAAGEKVGLVGRNGSGKTSLLKILAGVELANGGEVARRKELRVGYLPQEFDLDPEKSVLDNIRDGAADLVEWIRQYEEGEGGAAKLADLQHAIEAADGWNLDSRIKSIATALNTPPLEQKTADLSGGEKRRVALCRALVSRPDLLLLDEPTNHLDADSIRWLENYLREFSGAVIFVTHDRYFLDVIATSVAEIADGRCYVHPGNYTAYLENKALRQEIAEQTERRRQRFLRVELEWVRAGVKARTTKSRNRMDNYYQIAGQAAPPEEREMDLLLPPPAPLGDLVIDIEGAGAIVPAEHADRWLFRNLTLRINPGECTGIVGPNGAGKTTLLNIALGNRHAEEGTAKMGKKVVVNYIDQNRMKLNPEASVLEEVSDHDGVVFFGDQKISARAWLRRFLFADDRAHERVDRLSGGERARLMLAKVLKRGGNLIVLDEPTNDLDLPSLRMLEEALADFQGSAIVVSHDRYFLDRVCDQIVAFEPSGVFVQRGNYSYYLEKRAEREKRDRAYSAGTPKPAAPAGQEKKEARAKPRKLSFKEKAELEGMETAILEAEEKLRGITDLLEDPAFFITRSAEAPGLSEEAEGLRQEIGALYDRWEELEALASAAAG